MHFNPHTNQNMHLSNGVNTKYIYLKLPIPTQRCVQVIIPRGQCESYKLFPNYMDACSVPMSGNLGNYPLLQSRAD